MGHERTTRNQVLGSPVGDEDKRDDYHLQAPGFRPAHCNGMTGDRFPA